MCLAAKPVVDRLEKQLEGKARIIRVQLSSETGRALGKRYDIDVVPSFIVFAPGGRELFRKEGARGVPLKDLRRALGV